MLTRQQIRQIIIFEIRKYVPAEAGVPQETDTKTVLLNISMIANFIYLRLRQARYKTFLTNVDLHNFIKQKLPTLVKARYSIVYLIERLTDLFMEFQET